MSFFSDIGAGINSLINDGNIDYDEENFENVALNAMKKGTSSKDAAALLATWRSSNNLAKEMDKAQENGIGFFQNDVLISAKNWIDKIIKQIKLKSGSFFEEIKFSYPSTEKDSKIEKADIKEESRDFVKENKEDSLRREKGGRSLDD